MNFKQYYMFIFLMPLYLYAETPLYTIRKMCSDDRQGMIENSKKNQKFYSDYVIESSDEIVEEMVDRACKAYETTGFGFVIEEVVENGERPKLLAYFVFGQIKSEAFKHILYASGCSEDPDFRKNDLMGELLFYMLQDIKDHHPEILRVQWHGIHPINIAIMQRCGFIEEGHRKNYQKLPDGTFATEILGAWMNPNFKVN
ncbi:hypothetical protein KBC04_02470 [Candidatus Babeliales bacterium]|nr:hypothetical protein [Candidatus Babeliales bacterium]MBP9843726.1 hypothetical protein [Candidatus Babeliales bacterium]